MSRGCGFQTLHVNDQRHVAVAEDSAAGEVKSRETIVDGLDQAVAAFLGLFSGQNIGKMLVRLA
jgi:NADPH-dependent curcumin reductase CurA